MSWPKPYRHGSSLDAKAFATTLGIVVGRLWKKGKLKAAADPLVRSGLSVGIGWLKAAWHRETGSNPALHWEIAGLQSSLAAINQLQAELAEGIVRDDSAQRGCIRIEHIQPDKPQQNAYVERYNRTVRCAWLAMTLFDTVEQVQDKVTRWHNH